MIRLRAARVGRILRRFRTLRRDEGKARKSKPDDAPPYLLDLAHVARYVSLSERFVRQLVAEGRFPRPRPVGRKKLWLRRDVEAWADDLPHARI